MTTPTKPRLRLVTGPVWACFDAHIERRGKGWRQAYDRWLAASLKNALRIAGLVTPGTGPRPLRKARAATKALQAKAQARATKLTPARPVLRMPADRRNCEISQTGTSGDIPKTEGISPTSAGRTPLRVTKAEEQARASAKVRPPLVDGAEHATYAADLVRTVRGAAARPAYRPPVGLQLNHARALADQPALMTLSRAAEGGSAQ